jgi:hypothetical protein
MGPAINVGMDTLLVSVIINCCGEFRVLKYSLRTIRERAENLLALEKLPKVESFSVSEALESENSRREQPGYSTGEPCTFGTCKFVIETGRFEEVPQDVSASWCSTLELILKMVLSDIHKDAENNEIFFLLLSYLKGKISLQ